jgi:hypothetical protein
MTPGACGLLGSDIGRPDLDMGRHRLHRQAEFTGLILPDPTISRPSAAGSVPATCKAVFGRRDMSSAKLRAPDQSHCLAMAQTKDEGVIPAISATYGETRFCAGESIYLYIRMY